MTQYTGTNGNDTLTGSAGNDVLDGGPGADSMSGGAGDDVYLVDDAGDTVLENAGEGSDRINSTVSYGLPAQVENLWLVGGAAIDGSGNGLDNLLWGNGAANVLSGGGGNDTIDAGAGADTMSGGTGDDTFWVDDAGDLVIENPGEGSDTVKSTLAATTLGAAVENLVLLPGSGGASGTGNALDNQLSGNEGNNTLAGGGGSDVIDGGSGADTMSGGSGDDSFRVDDAGDLVIENTGEGTDTVTSLLASYTLPAQVENLSLGATYGSTEHLAGNGNELANTLRGNSGNNMLSGGGGDDTLIGGDGSDTLTGGTGNDVFYLYTTDAGTDTLTDLSVGDLITVCGVVLGGSVTPGGGATLGQGEVQLSASGGSSTLHIGTDATPGADMHIVLSGSYDAANFSLSGFDIRFDTNHAPVLATPLAHHSADTGVAQSWQLPAGSFTDADGDALTLAAQGFSADDGFLPLPAWLSFDAAQARFSGTPGPGDVGSVMIYLTATDTHGAFADGLFTLTVQAAVPADTTAPTITFSDDTAGTATGLVNYSLDFSETVTGLAADDFSIAHGSITSLTGSGSHYLLGVLPAAGSEASLTLTLTAGAVADAAGNPNAASTAAPQPVDTRAPVLTSFPAGAQAQGIALDSALVLGFSEPVQRGSGSLQLRNATGVLVESFDIATSQRLAISGAQLTLQPSQALAAGGQYTLQWAAGALRDLAGNATPAASPGFSTVTPPNHLPTGSVLISGQAQQGQALTAVAQIVDEDGLGTLHYQWQANGVDIPGATTASLVPTQAQVGQALRVWVRYTDGWQRAEALVSAATAPVADVNDAPSAQPLSASGPEDGAPIVLAPDVRDPDPGDLLQVQALTQPAHGTLRFDTTSGRFVYQPEADFNGSDGFDYRVTDAAGASATAHASITVLPANDAPLARPGSAQASEDGLLQGWLPAGTDVDGDFLRYALAANASHGNVQVLPDGRFIYQPLPNYNGSDSFSYSLSDGQASTTATLTLAVAAVNDAPTGSVTLNGQALQGERLSASHTLRDADGLGTVRYQWQADGQDIAGAEGASHLLTRADVGHVITVLARYTDGNGSLEQRPSAGTARVASADQQLQGSPRDDRLVGGVGDDTLAGGGGDDSLDGGAGTDTVRLAMPLAGVRGFTQEGGPCTLQLDGARLLLNQVERLRFDDALVALDTAAPAPGQPGGHTWQAAAIHQLCTGRLPSIAVLSQWTALADQSRDMADLAQRLLDRLAPDLGTAALVSLLYQQLMQAEPAPALVQGFVDQVGPGRAYATNGALLAWAACQDFNTGAMVGFTGLPQLLDADGFF